MGLGLCWALKFRGVGFGSKLAMGAMWVPWTGLCRSGTCSGCTWEPKDRSRRFQKGGAVRFLEFLNAGSSRAGGPGLQWPSAARAPPRHAATRSTPRPVGFLGVSGRELDGHGVLLAAWSGRGGGGGGRGAVPGRTF